MNHRQLRAQLNTLNEQLVEARRRGDVDTVTRLKQQIQAILAQAAASPETTPHLTPLTLIRKTPARDNTPQNRAGASKTQHARALMHHIAALNEHLVDARRRHDTATVRQLKQQLEGLLTGRAHNPSPSKTPTAAPETSSGTQRPHSRTTAQQQRAKIQALNDQIIQARRRGDHDEVQRLKQTIAQFLHTV